MTFIAAAFFIVNFFTYPSVERKASEKSLRAYFRERNFAWSFGTFSLELQGDALLTKSAHGETSFSVSLITEIIEAPNFIAIRRGSECEVLPRSAILEGSLEGFINELKPRLQPLPDLPPVPDAPLLPQKMSVQPGVYVFIFAAISGAVSFVVYAIRSSITPDAVGCGKKYGLVTSEKICRDAVIADYWQFGSAGLCAVLLLISAFLIYRNWNKESAESKESTESKGS